MIYQKVFCLGAQSSIVWVFLDTQPVSVMYVRNKKGPMILDISDLVDLKKVL